MTFKPSEFGGIQEPPKITRIDLGVQRRMISCYDICFWMVGEVYDVEDDSP